MTYDKIRRIVEQHWDKAVEAGCGYTVPALNLNRTLIEEYVNGKRDNLPGIEDAFEPRSFLVGVEGKEVLCLAAGGGQQSVAFALLGAKVTVLDICDGQLEGDWAAARHYRYEIKAVKGDAGDLSAFADASFDLVYQPGGINWMPEVRPVYREAYRVLRQGGRYRIALLNPAVLLTEWDGNGYRITERYQGGPVLRNRTGLENMREGEPTGDHRHLFRDSLGGLLETGFIIQYISEVPRNLQKTLPGEPGSWAHAECFLGIEIDIVVQKPS